MLPAFLLSQIQPELLWEGPRRGSWVREGKPQKGDVILRGRVRILLAPTAPANIRKAADLLCEDLKKLGVSQADRSPEGKAGQRILVRVISDPNQPESYRIRTDQEGIVVEGADDRGAAFGLYELSERLGIDPLYIWTGFTPKKHKALTVRATDFTQKPPAVRWRGLFHDDEDILPDKRDENGLTVATGKIPKIWFERYFETALRLRMNMVAPWVRTQRTYDIQKMASDWGLAYTSHHYDILLSNPYYFDRGLAKERGIEGKWDWVENKEGILRFWQAGVQENKDLDAIYPIGMRGTNDYGYRFPKEWNEDQRIGAFNEALAKQAQMVGQALPKDKPRLLHFTMYTEMLPYFQTGKLKVPEGTIVVWPDDNEGNMRGLPQPGATGKHGVYYHLAYLGLDITKQLAQCVPLERIEGEFRKIFLAGATEYELTNVSEIREYVMGERFINDLLWHGPEAFQKPNAADRFLDWWCWEYFGTPRVATAVKDYFASIHHPSDFAFSARKIVGAVASLKKKFAGEAFVPANPDTVPKLRERLTASAFLDRKLREAWNILENKEKRRFFEENVMLPAAIDRLNSIAAYKLVQAMSEPDIKSARYLCQQAKDNLDELDRRLRKAERPPFKNWYGPTWIAERNLVLVTPKKLVEELLGAQPKTR